MKSLYEISISNFPAEKGKDKYSLGLTRYKKSGEQIDYYNNKKEMAFEEKHTSKDFNDEKSALEYAKQIYRKSPSKFDDEVYLTEKGKSVSLKGGM